MGINVLGPLTVDGPGRLGPHDRVVLQALATRLGQPVRADELVDAVWGERPPASAHKNLQSCIVRLRKVLGTQAIETSPHGYVLAVPPDDLDAHDFEARVHRARALLAAGETDRVAFQLEQALAQWRGAAFADLTEWPPARREAGRLDELRLEAQEMHVDAMLRSGRAREALSDAHALVRATPLRERRWELLVLAQYQTGAQGEALRSLRQLRTVLARELGIDPSPEMGALEQSILNQDPSLMAPQPRTGNGECPWQGLKAYDVDDADRFFGRSRDVQACLDLLAAGSFAALVGPSGSGKSSIMRAGVLAVLRDRGRSIVLVTPTARPLDALTALPEGADERTVLAVDQTEEVFTLCDDPDERREFLDRLAREVARRPVVVTLRGDRLTQVTEHPEFSRLVERSLQLVGALDEAALREAITGPALMAGLVLQPGLVDLLVREVRDDPGALPLLSHALQETWRRREGNTMTVDGYHASGGIHGAVAQSAEQLYGSTPPDQRHLLRDLLLRLVSPGGEGEAVRTQVPRRLIAADEPHEQLVAMLVDARLVTSDAGVLEITHEALARAWPRLRGWLDDDVEGQRIRHHLSGAADAWDTLGRPDSELYRGVRLTRVLDWQSRTDSALTDAEREFLERARTVAELEEQTAADRARTQARLIRRLRIVLGGAVVLLALALVAGGFAAVQSDRANQNAGRAERAAVSADARRVGLRSQLTDDISLSLLLAVAGARLEDSPETRTNLMTALSMRPHLVRSAPPGGSYMEGLSVSPDGRWIAASDEANWMHLYDASTSRLLRSYDAGRPPRAGQAWIMGSFSPDSRQLAVVLESVESTDPVRLLDPDTMQPTATRLSSPGRQPAIGSDVQFSEDGRYLAASLETVPEQERAGVAAPTYVAVWDLRSPSTPPVRVPTGTAAQGIALSPDGSTLYTSAPLSAYRVASGTRIWRRSDITAFLGVDINTAGTVLALDGGNDGDGLLVGTAEGNTVATLRGHREAVSPDILFSHDDTLVGSSSRDGQLIVWDAATGRRLEGWDTFDPWGVGFSPDHDLVYGGGGDSMLRTWDLSLQNTYLQRTSQVGGSTAFAHAEISPNGQQVVFSWTDDTGKGWVRFADLVTGAITPPGRLRTSKDPWSLGAWHPEGRLYAARCEACPDSGAARLLDPTTGELIVKRKVVGGELNSLAYVDEGRSLFAGTWDGPPHVVDAETLRSRDEPLDVPPSCCATPIGGPGSTAMVYASSGDGISAHWQVIDVDTGDVTSEGNVDVFPAASVASPDGSTVAVGGDTGEIVVIDIASGAQRRSTSLGAPLVSLSYSDDGELLVSGASDGGASLWDAATLDLLGTVYPPHHGEPTPSSTQFIGDTRDVAIASHDGSTYRWDTEVDRALDFACQMAGRDLTEEEWTQVLPAQPYQSVCPQD
ncbi:winged helix-turn-helix domain-containing protein [Nocardioides cavernae]|uniref:Winged helix-turn-helix domain-containing protein n=1 Tax=Nocardioides cavernae TaxID=1921566 RepID=A0ABR8NAB1_9ACTN|nr:BTAD domain-containing putative transcriptional regulator [Nocardioides cavernae]MBD3925070.1 winged helix-turn-helix domain-containing protein [Nocardioides cavernae]MBM7514556.1 DNA-binding SARP family transcriptional activator/WD40 repeat protein/energy-coupling factor transporter ATP-binding protein EcfA2 [Nocardioides cavernae]